MVRLGLPVLAFAFLLSSALSWSATALAQVPADAQLTDVLQRMAAYVSSYGEQASVIVAVEKYTQELGDPRLMRPRRLVAEFAIVKTRTGWVGFRDVIEVNGEPVEDRRDRLLTALTGSPGGIAEATRIASESARFNIGPISRNFNVPTAALFFFQPANLARFTFKRKGTESIDDVQVWEIEFRETERPTMIMTRSGRDVPAEGTIWVSPADGAVVRTRLRLRNFADHSVMGDSNAAVTGTRPPVDPTVPTGGREAIRQSQAVQVPGGRIESSAEMEVTYRRHPDLRLWLPAVMTERYAGPIAIGTRTSAAGVTTRATYSDFKRFEASATVKVK